MGNTYAAKIEGAKACGRRVDVSPKHCIEVCTAIRGKTTSWAKDFLEKVTKKEAFVLLHKYKKQVPHRTGGKPGRYHVKAAGVILKLLTNAEATADSLGMDTEKLFIAHALANKADVYPRRKPKGKMKSHDITTCNIEIILQERQ